MRRCKAQLVSCSLQRSGPQSQDYYLGLRARLPTFPDVGPFFGATISITTQVLLFARGAIIGRPFHLATSTSLMSTLLQGARAAPPPFSQAQQLLDTVRPPRPDSRSRFPGPFFEHLQLLKDRRSLSKQLVPSPLRHARRAAKIFGK